MIENREERIEDEERTRTRRTSENWSSRRMDKVCFLLLPTAAAPAAAVAACGCLSLVGTGVVGVFWSGCWLAFE